MHQSVNATFKSNEDTEVGDGLNVTGNLFVLTMADAELFPWIRSALLDTQGDTTTIFVDVQNHHLGLVAN